MIKIFLLMDKLRNGYNTFDKADYDGVSMLSRVITFVHTHRSGLGLQVLITMLICLFSYSLHASNNGFWYQGDPVRHAANGLFWKDFIASGEWTSPEAYARDYYIRYPIINPIAYPPVFYILEALFFTLLGASPYNAKLLIFVFALMATLYTLAWLRRWNGIDAGWAAGFLLLEPGMLIWSHGIMLNVPGIAMGMAVLYHTRRSLETPLKASFTWHWIYAGLFTLLAIFTYPTAGVVLLVALAWLLSTKKRQFLWRTRTLWFAGLGILLLSPWIYAVYCFYPVQFAKILPKTQRLGFLRTWLFYGEELPTLFHSWTLYLAVFGAVTGLTLPRWRREIVFHTLWIAVSYLAFTIIPAREDRYILGIAIPFLCLDVIALQTAAEWLSRAMKHRQHAFPIIFLGLLGILFVVEIGAADRIEVARCSGFEEIAIYLKRAGPTDAVLYDGPYYGIFGFYLLANDPDHQRRFVRPDQLLSHAKCEREVFEAIKSDGAIHWIVLETGESSQDRVTFQLLQKLVKRKDFRWVRSFPISTRGVQQQVELYEFLRESSNDHFDGGL